MNIAIPRVVQLARLKYQVQREFEQILEGIPGNTRIRIPGMTTWQVSQVLNVSSLTSVTSTGVDI